MSQFSARRRFLGKLLLRRQRLEELAVRLRLKKRSGLGFVAKRRGYIERGKGYIPTIA